MNWGLKPFRMFNCWKETPGYSDFVYEKWRSFFVKGKAAYVAKEKLKLIKQSLKKWSKEHMESYEKQIQEAKE